MKGQGLEDLEVLDQLLLSFTEPVYRLERRLTGVSVEIRVEV